MINPEEVYESLKTRLAESVREAVSVKDGKAIKVNKLWWDDNKDTNDLESQKQAKLQNKTWSIPLYADVSLVDPNTGKTLDRSKRMRLLDLPKLTPRMTFIVGGEEFQIANQMRMRPGSYVKDKGTRVTAHFKMPIGMTKNNFFFEYSPKKKRWMMSKSNSTLPLYAFLRSMDIADTEIAAAVGPENLSRMQEDSDIKKDTAKLYRLSLKEKADPERIRQNQEEVGDFYSKLPTDPGINKLKFGTPHNTVSKGMVLDTLRQMGRVIKKEEPGDIDAARFKEFRTFDDILSERMQVSTPSTQWRIKRRMKEKSGVRDVVQPEKINRIALSFFNQSDLAHYPIQSNPVDILSGMTKTTVFGEGAIGSKRAIARDERNLDASSIFVTDPIHTPESEDIGVVTHVTLSAVKDKNRLAVRLRDPKTGKLTSVPHDELYNKTVAFPGEFHPAKSPMKPKKKMVSALRQGKIVEVPASEVDYVADSPARMFDFSSNLIPFLDSMHGGRALMASKMIDQAVSLKHRERPLVSAVTTDGGRTFDKLVGMVNSFSAPASGTVTAVKDDRIEIKDKDGKKHAVQIYDNFPLNDRHFITSFPRVEKGQKVKKGDLLADTNFTKDGDLAIGSNLRVAFIPYRGYNFEDGIVVSKSASEKLTSLHQYKFDLDPKEGGVRGKEQYLTYFPARLNKDQADKLDADGVVKPGTKIKRGDPIYVHLGPKEMTQEDAVLGKISKKLVRPYSDKAKFWDEQFDGVVTHVEKLPGGGVRVHVNTEEPLKVGDKLSSRYAAKGVVTNILPDEEMPKDTNGNPTEMLLNPHGLITRINPGQLYEAVASKIADKQGKPFEVTNFSGENNQEAIMAAAKKAGVSDTEELFDPRTGRSLGNVMVGKQYIMKLMHSSKEKFNARDPDGAYTVDLRPAKTSEGGAQSIGPMETYAMLSHGALENLSEMHTYKAERNPEFWRAITMKEPIPAPQPTFAFNKFLSYLKGAGIDTDKKGSKIKLKPFTDSEVELMSAGAVKSGRLLLGKNLEPERGGLFDERLTGGLAGQKWTHIDLPEPMPNPIFENAIRSVVGMTKPQLDDLLHSRLYLDRSGQLTKKDTGITGVFALRKMLKNVSIDDELKKARAAIKGKKGNELNQLNKKIRFLDNMKRGKVEFEDLFMKKIPVVPPMYRPIYPMPNGALQVSDLNYLYRDIIVLKNKLQDLKGVLPDEKLQAQRADLYDAVKALTGIGSPITNREYKGIMDIIVGENPKSSYFGSKIMKRRQELTGRASAIVDPNLSMDEVGIPEEMLWSIFKPMIQQKLVERGKTPLEADEMIKNRTPDALEGLDLAITERPVLMNRAPTLHKHGIIALKAKRVPGYAIRANPMIVSGLNLDFDGDTVAIHVPVSPKAVDESWKMLPSAIPFSVSGKVLTVPRHEAQIGLFRMTKGGKKTGKKFSSESSAIAALDKGELNVDDQVRVGPSTTTPGRIMINRVLPKNLRDPDLVLDKKTTEKVITEVAKNNPKQLVDVVDALKDMGNEYAYLSGTTVSMKDVSLLGKVKQDIFAKYDREADRLKKSGLSGREYENELIRLYSKADAELTKATEQHLKDTGSTFYEMIRSGARGDVHQVKQIVGAPTLVSDVTGRIIPHPIKSSFGEGMNPADYVASIYGSRKGHIEKTLQTAEPGAVSKSVVATAITNRIAENDCGDATGISFSIDDREAQGRYFAQDVPGVARRNDLFTDSARQRLKKKGVSSVQLRSPMSCQSPIGTCKKCYGLNEKGQPGTRGDFIGITAGHAISEPMTQLTLQMTHHGGVISPESKTVDSFSKLRTLLELPEEVQNAAALAPATGKVTSVDKGEGGWNIALSGKDEPIFTNQLPTVKKGQKVTRGQPVSEGIINPKEYLGYHGLDKTREMMTNEIYDIFGGRVRKKHVETVVRGATDTGIVTDAGRRDSFVEGDIMPINILKHENSKSSKSVPVKNAIGSWLMEDIDGVGIHKILTQEDIDTIMKTRKKKVKVNPSPVQFEPVLRGINLIPQSRKDWLGQIAFRNLKDAVQRGVAEGWETDVNSYNPIPGLVYAQDISMKGGLEETA